MKRPIRILTILAVISSMIISGCSSSNDKYADDHHAEESHSHAVVAANGDLQETTASIDVLPTFLDGASSQIRSAYTAASTVTDELQYIPCYCGCGESAGHRNNLHCFINEIKEDGSVVWDDHGTRCGVCMDIALATAELTEQGHELKDIRAAVDQAYAKGFAAPTVTPQPAE